MSENRANELSVKLREVFGDKSNLKFSENPKRMMTGVGLLSKDARFSTVYLIGELKKKGYFENIKCDSKALVKDILANCEVIG